ncbi:MULTISPECIES: hypothetical protein [Synechococcales]|nr:MULTISPECIES: hypothetical protein [unclassified Synechococcus]
MLLIKQRLGFSYEAYRLHRLVCPCCSTSTCAALPVDVELSRR